MAKKKKRTGICVRYMKSDKPTDCFWYETKKERAAAETIGRGAAKKSPALIFDCVEKGQCKLIGDTTMPGPMGYVLPVLIGVGAAFGIGYLFKELGV